VAFHEIQWYDRNPAIHTDYDEQINLGPHALTTRLEYTCPVDRMAMVELLQCSVERMTVAAPAAYASAIWFFTPAGEAEVGFLHARLLLTNLVGDNATRSVGTTLTLLPGDRIRARTADTSTGGTCYYYTSYKLTEFDAYLYHAAPKTRPEPLVDVQSAKPRPDPVM